MSRTVLAIATLQRVGDDWRILGPTSYVSGFATADEARAFLEADGWTQEHPACVLSSSPASDFEVFAREVPVDLFADFRHALEREAQARAQVEEARRRRGAVLAAAPRPWSESVTQQYVAAGLLIDQLTDAEREAHQAVEAARARLYGHQSKAA